MPHQPVQQPAAQQVPFETLSLETRSAGNSLVTPKDSMITFRIGLSVLYAVHVQGVQYEQTLALLTGSVVTRPSTLRSALIG